MVRSGDMDFNFGPDDFKPGSFVVYFNGGDRHVGPVELGVVKSVHDDGCFVAYSTGDTVAKTPYDCLLPVWNCYAVKGLVERAEQLGCKMWGLADGCESWA